MLCKEGSSDSRIALPRDILLERHGIIISATIHVNFFLLDSVERIPIVWIFLLLFGSYRVIASVSIHQRKKTDTCSLSN